MPARATPNARDLEILRAYVRLGGVKAANQCGCSRALVYQLRDRFPETAAKLRQELEQEPEVATTVVASASIALRTEAELSPALARITQAATLLKETRDPRFCVRLMKQAAALEHVAKLAHCTVIEAHTRAIRVDAERSLGAILTDLDKHPGGRPGQTCSRREQVFAKLADLRITRKQSASCQALARMAERAPALFERLRTDLDFSRAAALCQFRKLEKDVDSEPEPEPEPEPAVMNVVIFGTTEDQWRKVMSYLGRLPRGAVFHCGTITAEQFRRWTRGSGPAPWETEPKEAEAKEAEAA